MHMSRQTGRNEQAGLAGRGERGGDAGRDGLREWGPSRDGRGGCDEHGERGGRKLADATGGFPWAAGGRAGERRSKS